MPPTSVTASLALLMKWRIIVFALFAFIFQPACASAGSCTNGPSLALRPEANMVTVRLSHARQVPHFVRTLRLIQGLAGPCSRVALVHPDIPRAGVENTIVLYNSPELVATAIAMFRNIPGSDGSTAYVNAVRVADVQHAWPEQIRGNSLVRRRDALSNFHEYRGLWDEYSNRSLIPVFRQEDPSTYDSDAFYSEYHVYDDHVRMWNSVAARYADHVKLEIIGNTSEKRPIVAVRISRNTNSDNVKRVVITGLLHAREWISAAASTYMIHHLALSVASGKGQVYDLLDKIEVIVIPILNPDGYIYSAETDRFWRKNTRVLSTSTGCIGVDLNRNWAIDFGGMGGGSNDPCEEDFTGPEAFSESETAAVKTFFEGNPRIVAHLDIHSFGEFVLGPWSYTNDPPPRVEEVDRFGNDLASSINAKHGLKYRFGRGDTLLYLASGTCSDWFFDRGAMSATVEMRPGNDTKIVEKGFQLDKAEILPASEELFAGLLYVLQFAASKKISDGNSSKRNTIIWAIVAGLLSALVTLAVVLIFCYALRRRKSYDKGRPSKHSADDVESQPSALAKSNSRLIHQPSLHYQRSVAVAVAAGTESSHVVGPRSDHLRVSGTEHTQNALSQDDVSVFTVPVDDSTSSSRLDEIEE